MELPLLKDLFIIFALSTVALFFCLRARIPTIVGFLLTGIFAGPHGFGLIKAVHEVETMAEIGVVLLLFTIGIEFSLKDLLRIKKPVILGGSVQVLFTILVFSLIAYRVGHHASQALFMGFMMSLSSTAVVLKILQERAEIDSPHGRTSLGILIFQDLIVVPMILIAPVLAGINGSTGMLLSILVLKGAVVLAIVMMSARWLIPNILYQIVRTRNREIFLLSVIVICFAIAWLTYAMGLSLALGAFLAGLVISESEYSHQALGNIMPFRDIFMSFFFVSIGMLLNVDFFFHHIGIILLVTVGILILKSFIAGFTTAILGFPLRTIILVGLALSQVGEFSFVLSRTGIQFGLIAQDTYQLFLAVSILTLIATPFLILFSPRIVDFAFRLPLPDKLKTGLRPIATTYTGLMDHLIVIGFGLNGRNVARAAALAGVPYVIAEMNPETVRSERAKGQPIFFGDAAHETILEHTGIKRARIIAVTIADPVATRKVVAVARAMNPRVFIIARTRYVQEMAPLLESGANEVIPEEYETSVEIFSRILVKYLIPRDEIERFITDVRADGYSMLRSLSPDAGSCPDLRNCLPDIEISTLRVSEKAPIVGTSLEEIELRRRYGVTVLAIRKDSQIFTNPSGDMKIHANDILFVLGTHEQLSGVMDLFHVRE